MSQISLSIPQVGLPDTTEDVKVANNFTTIQNVVNGNLDTTNLSAAAAQSACVNQSGQTVKGSFIKLGTDSTSSATFGTLSTPDQVSGIVLGANAVLYVSYRCQWVCTAASAASAAIFLNSNQLVVDNGNATIQAGQTNLSVSANVAQGMSSYPLGLLSNTSGTNLTVNDPTTGMAMGVVTSAPGGGGPCEIFAAAGTYTVSIMFKTSSGTVSVSNRRLYVEARSYA